MSAYNLKVNGEIVSTYHFEEDLKERDLELLKWYEKSSYQIDNVAIESRPPIPGVRPISFKQWMAQNMTGTEIVSSPPEEPIGLLRFKDDMPGEDLTHGGKRRFRGETLSAEVGRVDHPVRKWLYLRVDSIRDLEDLDMQTEEGRAYALDYALRSFEKAPGTRIELGVSQMSDSPMIAVWNGEDPSTDDDQPEW